MRDRIELSSVATAWAGAVGTSFRKFIAERTILNSALNQMAQRGPNDNADIFGGPRPRTALPIAEIEFRHFVT
jgi:hypothetical protein